MEGTIANITNFAGNFAPRNWAYCHGQLLAISQYDALFSLLGTNFGGDGRTSFALPNLSGRTSIGTGHGPGLSDRRIGEWVGSEDVTLTIAHMPAHNHSVRVDHAGHIEIPVNTAVGDADEASPGSGVLANSGGDVYASSASMNAVYSGSPLAVNGLEAVATNTGAGKEFNNMQPSLALPAIICMFGIYPSRS
ncbi:MAG: tail fiber protein [Gammaproteobacteria bacterium]|jgi:microcystin-dependent protein|nr:tail fiber protein [Gammaproteobacteria bacterium]